MASRTRLGESMRARKRSHSSLTRAHSPSEVGEGHEGPLPGRGAWLEAEGPLLGVEGEGEEGLEALPVQDAGPHHLPGGEAQDEGQNPLPHLQDPGAPVGVDELQDLREGKDLQVAFHLNPSPSPRTSIRPSPR